VYEPIDDFDSDVVQFGVFGEILVESRKFNVAFTASHRIRGLSPHGHSDTYNREKHHHAFSRHHRLCLFEKPKFALITIRLYHTRYGIVKCRPTMSHTIQQKKELLLRAKRIQGQVEALVRALTEERDCSEVLQVMRAARGAMNSLMAELLEGHIRSHVLSGKHKASSQQLVAADEVIDMVKSYLK
jgi:DNA-binding FrmR family transcriptional regulator